MSADSAAVRVKDRHERTERAGVRAVVHVRALARSFAQARVLQPQVIKNYVTDLARAKRYTQAQAVILRMRRNHARAGQFMEQEFRLLDATNYGRQTASH